MTALLKNFAKKLKLSDNTTLSIGAVADGEFLKRDGTSVIGGAVDLSGYVPYTGATTDVNLGSNSLTAGAGAFSGQFTNAQGTLTSSTPATFTQTWNEGLTTFTGLKLNVTDTASASASLLMDLQVGGSSKFKVDKTGDVIFTSYGSGVHYYPSWTNYKLGVFSGGTAGTYPMTLRSQLCEFRGQYNTIIAAIGDYPTLGVVLAPGYSLGWSTNCPNGPGDVALYRDALGILHQRATTTAQTFRVSGSYTSASSRYGIEFQGYSANLVPRIASVDYGGTMKGLEIGGDDDGVFTSWLTFSNTGAATFANTVNTAASTTAAASLNVPSGTAPTTPNNGDIWSDGSDLFIRLGGVTYTIQKA